MKKYTINFADRQVEMIEEIKEVEGYLTVTEIMHTALRLLYRKAKPAYSNQSMMTTSATPEDRAKKKIEIKQATEKVKMDAKIKEKTFICEQILGGKMVKNDSGVLVCKYSNYFADGTPDEEQTLGIDVVNKSYANYQFFPDKKTVLEKRPELRKKFKE